MDTTNSAHRVLLALEILHEQGYEQLRLNCGMSPSGMNWRYAILPRKYFKPENGLHLSYEHKTPGHPLGSLRGNEVKIPDANELAAQWLKECPALHEGKLNDAVYAFWYKTMLNALIKNEVPIMYADWEVDIEGGLAVGKKIMPLPVF